jgi:hypothetical protein
LDRHNRLTSQSSELLRIRTANEIAQPFPAERNFCGVRLGEADCVVTFSKGVMWSAKEKSAGRKPQRAEKAKMYAMRAMFQQTD